MDNLLNKSSFGHKDNAGQWYEVRLTASQVARGLHIKLDEEFRMAFHAAGAPEGATLYNRWEGATDVFYFTPACGLFCSDILSSFEGSPCRMPEISKDLIGVAGCKTSLSLYK